MSDNTLLCAFWKLLLVEGEGIGEGLGDIYIRLLFI